MTSIAFIRRMGSPYDWVSTRSSAKPWLNHLKKKWVGPDESIYYYMKYTFPDITVKMFTRKIFIERPEYLNKFDITFLGFEELTLPFKEMVLTKQNSNGYKRYVSGMKRVKNLYPSYKFVDFIADKCKYYSFLQKNGIPIAPTKCFKTTASSAYMKRELKKLPWKRTFIKPTPSAESTNVNSFAKDNFKSKRFNEHIRYLRNRKFDKVVAQRFVNNFATSEHPELRTFWIANKYQYTIETTEKGYDWNIRERPLPKIVSELSKKTLKLLESKFKAPLIITRLDWGFDGKRYFMNEIEYAPGTFAEIFPEGKWDLDKKIGDVFANIAFARS